MTYPCEIIRDLLPLSIDNVCSQESKQAIEHHLSQCESCRMYCDTMKSTDGFAETNKDGSMDMKMADSLKNVKKKINRKIKRIVLCAASAALFFTVGFYLLFHAVIKNVSPKDVSISADVYSLAELIEKTTDNQEDPSETVDVTIPNLGRMTLTRDTIETCQYATIITVRSDYFLRTVKTETKDKTIFIKAFKTTLLNNKSENYQKQLHFLELEEIDSIVFADGNGSETVLWSRSSSTR